MGVRLGVSQATSRQPARFAAEGLSAALRVHLADRRPREHFFLRSMDEATKLVDIVLVLDRKRKERIPSAGQLSDNISL